MIPPAGQSGDARAFDLSSKLGQLKKSIAWRARNQPKWAPARQLRPAPDCAALSERRAMNWWRKLVPAAAAATAATAATANKSGSRRARCLIVARRGAAVRPRRFCATCAGARGRLCAAAPADWLLSANKLN